MGMMAMSPFQTYQDYVELVVVMKVEGRTGGFTSHVYAPGFDQKAEHRLYVSPEDIGSAAAATRRHSPSSWSANRDIGARLFASLFEGEVGSIRESVREHAAKLGAGVRLRLHFRSHESPLVPLPWELMFDSRREEFILWLPQETIVRSIGDHAGVAMPVPPGQSTVLVISSGPQARPSQVAEELRVVREALGLVTVKVEHLENPDRHRLAAALVKHLPTMIHYIGSGVSGGAGGERILLARDGSTTIAELKDAYQLSPAELVDLLPTVPPALLSLNACDTAGFAAALANRLPAVYGWAGSMTDDDYVAFARGLFSGLAKRMRFDAAIAAARQEVTSRASSLRGSLWVVPVMYMRGEASTLLSAASPSATPDERTESPIPRGAARTNPALRKLELRREMLERNLRSLDARMSTPGFVGAPDVTRQREEVKAALAVIEHEILAVGGKE